MAANISYAVISFNHITIFVWTTCGLSQTQYSKDKALQLKLLLAILASRTFEIVLVKPAEFNQVPMPYVGDVLPTTPTFSMHHGYSVPSSGI